MKRNETERISLTPELEQAKQGILAILAESEAQTFSSGFATTRL